MRLSISSSNRHDRGSASCLNLMATTSPCSMAKRRLRSSMSRWLDWLSRGSFLHPLFRADRLSKPWKLKHSVSSWLNRTPLHDRQQQNGLEGSACEVHSSATVTIHLFVMLRVAIGAVTSLD